MPTAGTSFEFGPFRLEPAERRLVRDGGTLAIAPKAFDLLVILVEHPDRLLKKDELMERLWPGVFVEEVNLAQNISAIRRVLGGESRESYIQTVAGGGYRFVAPVRRSDAPRTDRQRLLVLPFRMLKPDPDLDFMAFSLPDALTASLSALDSVIVRSSLVAARFADDAPDLRRIAREAQVDLVVSGTILRAGGELRVSAQLADASAGTLVWSHTAQTSIDDLFQLQDLLVARIADSLATPLTPPEQRRLRRDVPATAKAYEYFLRANEANPASVMSLERATLARDLYLQSVREDAGYAPAWARLARVYRLLGKYGTDEAAANLARADEALERALALNPDLSMAQNLYAQMEVDRGRAERAMVRLLERLRERGPHAEIFAGLVQACRFCGLLDASAAAHDRAHRLDPALGTSVMHTYFLMERYDAVVEVSGDVRGYVFALSLVALGRTEEALSLVATFEAGTNRLVDLLVAVRALIEGKQLEAVEALTRAARTSADPEARYYLARHFARLEAPRRALEELAKAVDGGYFCYGPMTTDAWFDGLRSDAEFRQLLDRARAGHESAAAAYRAAGGP